MTVAARTPFCVYCSQLSFRRPATKETRPDANSSLLVSLLETSLGVETGTRYYTTAVPVNYISLRVFTGSISSSTGRIRARFGGKFPLSKSKALTVTPFSSSSTVLIVESSSNMPSTPDAPDCGSRSREMYNVAMVFDSVF